MSFINHKIWKQILDARKNGNPDATRIYDKFFEDGCKQDEINRLVECFLHPVQSDSENNIDDEAVEATEGKPSGKIAKEQSQPQEEGVAIIDISGDLDNELDGLLDPEIVDDDDFEEFLKKKRTTKKREKKNSAYFKAFDAEGRKKYLGKKNDEYSHSYDTKRRDIERGYNDMGKALGIYLQSVTDLPDDEKEYSSDDMEKAYDKFLDESESSHSLGRSWDEQDVAQVVSVLKGLVDEYGKKNVVAVLNTLSQDNIAHRNARIDSIDKAIKDYGDKLKKLIGD